MRNVAVKVFGVTIEEVKAAYMNAFMQYRQRNTGAQRDSIYRVKDHDVVTGSSVIVLDVGGVLVKLGGMHNWVGLVFCEECPSSESMLDAE